MQQTDIALIQRAARGDPDAFTEFFEQYYQQVYNFALWLCNDEDQAQDLTQDTFIKAHGSLNRLGPPYNARSWLYRIARNLFVDNKRRAPAEQTLDPEAPLAGNEPDPERQVMQAELAGVVRRAMQRLAPNYREALVLREVEGFHYDEIAGIMDMSMDSVKVLLHRARNSFRDHYGVRLLTEDPLPECTVLNELLDTFYDGEALDAQERAVRAHLKDCPRCMQRTREIAALGVLLKGVPALNPPADARRHALANARRRSPRRVLTIAAVVGALLLIGGGALAAGGLGRGGGGAVSTATPAVDAPSPTVPIVFPAVATDSSATPIDTPAGTVSPTATRAAQDVVTRTPAAGITVTVGGVTPAAGGGGSVTPEGADGSLCGDGVCQAGENVSWCGDCKASDSGGGGITDTPPIKVTTPPPKAICGNGILEAGEQCEHDADCAGNAAGSSCFVPGCFCGPG